VPASGNWRGMRPMYVAGLTATAFLSGSRYMWVE
jgi:hypothetical protein